jgi:3-oxoadipate enol-lactonase/4-carboxymuconolactone decarboxylase
MPIATVDGARIYYRLEGRDDLPVLMLVHSLGVDHGQWDLQTAALLPHFRILRYDLRGHGGSETTPGDYTMERLGRDLLGLADALGIERFALCGLSIGGMIGQWVAAHAAHRLTHLVLANTSARFPDPTVMETRRRTVLESGMAAIEAGVMQRFFTAETLSRGDAAAASVRATLLATNPAGYAGCCAAVRDMDHRGLLAGIRTPVLIVCGSRDVSTPWSGHGEVLAHEIAGARVVHLDTAHLSNLERPRAFTAALAGFLLPAPAGDPREAGFAMRRGVLGDAHVDRATANATDFTREFQEWITRYAWGSVWTRPGLDVRTRRLLVLAMTAALGRWEEYRLHVRTGLAGGLELCDLKEALLQVAVYAGVPAANTAFHLAEEEAGGHTA